MRVGGRAWWGVGSGVGRARGRVQRGNGRRGRGGPCPHARGGHRRAGSRLPGPAPGAGVSATVACRPPPPPTHTQGFTDARAEMRTHGARRGGLAVGGGSGLRDGGRGGTAVAGDWVPGGGLCGGLRWRRKRTGTWTWRAGERQRSPPFPSHPTHLPACQPARLVVRPTLSPPNRPGPQL